MEVKSQIKDVQFELTTEAAKAGLTAKVGRFVYAVDSGNLYIGDGANWIQQSGSKVGDIKVSALDVPEFTAEHGADWILCDGRLVTGSAYHTLTGRTNVPDLRGRFARGKDHGTGNNPDGDLAIGSYQADEFASHTHGAWGQFVESANYGAGTFTAWNPAVNTPSTQATGGNETRPKSVTVNYFIKINR